MMWCRASESGAVPTSVAPRPNMGAAPTKVERANGRSACVRANAMSVAKFVRACQ